ncbi:SIR2 family protein [Runella slithyformis]|uniref:SIR2-like domain-containing protein n=1 Tax=Runella slithyformis (strain ATCC 29530 / DSM 19594 / LMG 11500 / NCIMB 11436 / LSU 4) TaxID=761193 RepID=A0A7U4E540_RUNSL|nr:SIR2 family protein [Runella slithyformis]AEI48078.1 hypothetical protein Runsl_1653 [Runella slithyformis DSM 19594]
MAIDTEKQLEELVKDIVNDKVVVVAGTGVSLLSLEKTNWAFASWEGLLRAGVQYCKEHDLINKDEESLILAQINTQSTIFMTSAAQQIVYFMKGRGVHFQRWIQQTVATLKVADKRLINTILRLNCPIMTTNYDNLIEQVNPDLSYYNADREQVLIIEAIRKRDPKYIIHLHGHFRHPDSLVFDISSYEDIKRNEQIQALLNSIDTTATYLFIGCGVAGLNDANLGPLLHRSNELFGNVGFKHYRLVRDSELKEVSSNRRLVLLSYGKEYSDLLPFMETLLNKVKALKEYHEKVARDLLEQKLRASQTSDQEELDLLNQLIRMNKKNDE